MRESIKKLVEMGSIPSYEDATEQSLDEYVKLLHAIEKPVSIEEAKALIKLFSPDDIGGINYTIIHIVETAPEWSLQTFLENEPESDAVNSLIAATKNAGLWK